MLRKQLANAILAISAFLTVSCTTLERWSADEYSPEAPYRGAIPRRKESAPTGSAFVRSVAGLTTEQREDAILRELRGGNIPGLLRALKPVRVSGRYGSRSVQGTIWVMPDYLAIGSNDDYVYMPMNPLTAQRVADHYGFMLPTRKLVDDIYAQSTLRVDPRPMRPGPTMISTGYYEQHSQTIREQLGARRLAALTAGHKKDIVLTNRLCQQRRRVAIYGWHRSEGQPIQPLSLVHGDHYADYSHGVRLIANTMIVEGVERPVAEVMQDPRYASLLSDEGIIRQTRIATECHNC